MLDKIFMLFIFPMLIEKNALSYTFEAFQYHLLIHLSYLDNIQLLNKTEYIYYKGRCLYLSILLRSTNITIYFVLIGFFFISGNIAFPPQNADFQCFKILNIS
jgi:hypothetical protein